VYLARSDWLLTLRIAIVIHPLSSKGVSLVFNFTFISVTVRYHDEISSDDISVKYRCLTARDFGEITREQITKFWKITFV